MIAAPRHHYTAGLLRSVPQFEAVGSERPTERRRLKEIPGVVPRLDQLPPGCRFADRCERVQPRCRSEAPQLETIAPASPETKVRCFYPLDPQQAAA